MDTTEANEPSAAKEKGLDPDQLVGAFERLRLELTNYLTRLVVRTAVAEDLVQQTALQALESIDSAPRNTLDLRPWLFRIATNLGIDEQRRHGRWREQLMLDAQAAAETQAPFLATAESLQGSPEMKFVAREHLAICFSCTLGQLRPEHAAALLLKEVHGYKTATIAEILDARFSQVKNWLQSARATMKEKYSTSCALIHKDGVCYQCVELDNSFGANRGNPLSGTDGTLEARLKVLNEVREQPAGRWTHMLTELLDEIN